jgi:acyl-CoA synthetase (AMP-forming)/AMP-acid ligase II
VFTAPTYLTLAKEAQEIAKEEFEFKIVDLANPSTYDAKAISRYSSSQAYQVALDPVDEAPLTAFIVHSSGSTGFPKPIYITHQSTCFNIATNFNLAGFTTLPLYHNHGHSCFWRALYSCKILWLFPASDLPLTAPYALFRSSLSFLSSSFLTSSLLCSNVMNILDQPQVQVDALFGVPYIYKMLEESQEGLDMLKKFKLCLFGGSAMPTELGDRLVEAGVRLAGHYGASSRRLLLLLFPLSFLSSMLISPLHTGATEVGQLMTSFRDYETDKEWAYNRPPAALKPYLVWEDRGAGTMEAVVLDGWKGKVRLFSFFLSPHQPDR